MDEDVWVGKCVWGSRKLSIMILNKAFKETELLQLQRESPCRGKRPETEHKAQSRQSLSVQNLRDLWWSSVYLEKGLTRTRQFTDDTSYSGWWEWQVTDWTSIDKKMANRYNTGKCKIMYRQKNNSNFTCSLNKTGLFRLKKKKLKGCYRGL